MTASPLIGQVDIGVPVDENDEDTRKMTTMIAFASAITSGPCEAARVLIEAAVSNAIAAGLPVQQLTAMATSLGEMMTSSVGKDGAAAVVGRCYDEGRRLWGAADLEQVTVGTVDMLQQRPGVDGGIVVAIAPPEVENDHQRIACSIRIGKSAGANVKAFAAGVAELALNLGKPGARVRVPGEGS